MSFVMGLSRLAVHVVAQTDTNDPERNYVAAFTAAVNREDIMKAVNENDFGLAYSNFLKIEPLILELAGENIGDYPLNKNNIEAFHFFLSRGIDKWFTEEPLEHWTTMDEGHGNGWESFLDRHVKPNIIKEQIVNLNKKLNDIRNTKATTTKLLKAQLTALKRLDPTAKIKKVVTVKQEIEVKIAMPAV